jgi:hypothetical protein
VSFGRQAITMKATLFKALRTYLVVTVIMVVDIAIAFCLFNLLSDRWEHTEAPSADLRLAHGAERLKPAQEDSAILEGNLRALSNRHANLRVTLDLCGEPDEYKGDIQSDLQLIYYYSRFAKKDWGIQVDLKNGKMTGMTSMDASFIDHSLYKKWDVATQDIPTHQ